MTPSPSPTLGAEQVRPGTPRLRSSAAACARAMAAVHGAASAHLASDDLAARDALAASLRADGGGGGGGGAGGGDGGADGGGGAEAHARRGGLAHVSSLDLAQSELKAENRSHGWLELLLLAQSDALYAPRRSRTTRAHGPSPAHMHHHPRTCPPPRTPRTPCRPRRPSPSISLHLPPSPSTSLPAPQAHHRRLLVWLRGARALGGTAAPPAGALSLGRARAARHPVCAGGGLPYPAHARAVAGGKRGPRPRPWPGPRRPRLCVARLLGPGRPRRVRLRAARAVGPAGSHRSVRRTLATRHPPSGGLWYPGAVPDARLAVRLERLAATVLRRGAFRASCAAAPHRPPARDKPVLPVTRAHGSTRAAAGLGTTGARLEGSTRVGNSSSTLVRFLGAHKPHKRVYLFTLRRQERYKILWYKNIKNLLLVLYTLKPRYMTMLDGREKEPRSRVVTRRARHRSCLPR